MTTRTLTQSLNDAVKLIQEQMGSQIDAKCDMTLLKNGDVRVKLNMLVKEPEAGLAEQADLEQPRFDDIGFKIELTNENCTGVHVLFFDDGDFRIATRTEVALWKLLIASRSTNSENSGRMGL